MLPVEILPVQETIVLRARGSELLILPQHVKELKSMTKPKDFSHYFRAEALVNRPARKLFEAWLRKDHTLWPRLYQTVHKEMDLSGSADGESDAPKAKAKPTKSEAKAPETSKTEAKATESAKADKVKASKEKDAPKATKAEKVAAPAKKEKAEAKAEKPAAKAKAKDAKEDKAEKPAKAVVKAKTEKAAAKPEAKAKEKAKPAAKKKG